MTKDLSLYLSFRSAISLFHFPFPYYINKTTFAFFLSALLCLGFSNAHAALTPPISGGPGRVPIIIISPPSMALTITTQPYSQTITGSGTVSFSVAVTGTPVITYQWLQSVNGGPFIIIPGATNSVYTTSVTFADNGTRYECVVSNTTGSVTSTIATLTVTPILVPPSITTQPINATVTVPATASFTVSATGTPAPTYQWMQSADGKTWTNVTTGSGGTSSSYTTAATTLANNGILYECVITNLVGNETSSMALLTVNAPVPSAPKLNSAVPGNGQVALSWGSVTGAEDYTVFYGTSTGQYPISITAGTGTSLTIFNLTNGTPYYFVVMANDGVESSGNSNELSATPILPTPTLNQPVSGDTQVSLSWNMVPAAINYTIHYGIVPGQYSYSIPAGYTTNFTVTGLTDGTPYYFVVTANDAAYTTGYSNMFSATPLPMPLLTPATPGNAQVTLYWYTSSTTGLISYTIWYGTAKGVYTQSIPVASTSGAPIYTVQGLTNGTPYYFVVTATYTAGTSGYSNVINATPKAPPPVAPQVNLPAAGNGQVSLTWNQVSGATSYSVSYGLQSKTYGAAIPVPTSDGTTYTVTGLTNGIPYYFVVNAINSGGPSPNSNEVNATPQVPPPIAPVLNLPSAGNAQVSLTWNPVTGAASYSVSYGVKSKTYGTPIPVTTGTSTTVTGLTNGTPYYFVVNAINAGGPSSNSNEVSATPEPPPPGIPVLSTPVAGNGQVTLTWGSVTGAASYTVYDGTTSGIYGTGIPAGSGTSYTVSNLTNGTKYYFALKAGNGGGTSGYSTAVNATPLATAMTSPALNPPTVGDGQVALSWSSVTGAVSYIIKYASVSKNIGSLTSFTATGLTNGTTYSFVVAGVNSAGTSGPNSNAESAIPAVSAVTLTYTYDDLNRMTNEQKSPTSTKLSYDEVGNVLSLNLGVIPNTHIDPDASSPTVPTSLTASAVSSHQVNLTWHASTDDVGVFGYIIYRDGFKVATTTQTSFSDVSLVSGIMYSYTVKAIDAAGNTSTASSTQTLTTP